MSMQLDLDAIADGIANKGATRRTVTKGAAWSLPVIAAGIAAPTASATPVLPTCGCATASLPCLIGIPGTNNPAGPGDKNCGCAAGLICVGTGPLNILNVCVGSDIIAQTCGSSTCYGVCLGTSSPVVTAVNALIVGLSGFATDLVNIIGSLAFGSFRACAISDGIPANVCASPIGNDGSARLGVPCLWHEVCTAGLLGGAVNGLLQGLVDLVVAVETAFGGMGLAVVTPAQCEAKGLVCTPVAGAAFKLNTFFGITPGFVLDVGVGFCECPGGTTCKGSFNTPCDPFA